VIFWPVISDFLGISSADRSQILGLDSTHRDLQNDVSHDSDRHGQILITDQVIADLKNPLPSNSAQFIGDHNKTSPVAIGATVAELFGPE